jgi:hypothetical protein
VPENVVICCAEEDEPRLAPVVAALHDRRCTPELLSGIDADPTLFGSFIDANDTATLYVLCESERFTRRAVLQAEGMFGARRGPGDSISRVLLDAHTADQVAARVVAELAGGTAPAKAAPKHGLRKEILGQPSGRGAGGSSSSASAPRSGGRVSSAARAGSEANAAAPRVRGASGTAAAAAGDSPPPDSFAPKETPVDPSVMDRLGPASASGGAEQDDDGGGVEIDLDSQQGAPLQSEAPVSLMPSAAEGRSRTSIMVLLVVLLAASATAWLVTKDRTGREASRGERGAVVASTSTAGTGVEGQPGGKGEDTGEPPSRESGAELPSAGTGSGGELEVAPPQVEFNPGEETELLRRAIEAGQLRILDLQYVHPAPRQNFDYEQAQAYCEALEIGGLSGFRLPGPKELKRIRRSHMLERGRFWTNKPAGEGFAYVLDTDKNPAVARARTRFGIRANCVRDR